MHRVLDQKLWFNGILISNISLLICLFYIMIITVPSLSTGHYIKECFTVWSIPNKNFIKWYIYI